MSFQCSRTKKLVKNNAFSYLYVRCFTLGNHSLADITHRILFLSCFQELNYNYVFGVRLESPEKLEFNTLPSFLPFVLDVVSSNLQYYISTLFPYGTHVLNKKFYEIQRIILQCHDKKHYTTVA
jgi:hypothetical protein